MRDRREQRIPAPAGGRAPPAAQRRAAGVRCGRRSGSREPASRCWSAPTWPRRRARRDFPNNWVSFHRRRHRRALSYDGAESPRGAARRPARRACRGGRVSNLPHRRSARVTSSVATISKGPAASSSTGSPRGLCEPVAADPSRRPRRFCPAAGLRALTFDACDGGGRAIYHTNVLMAIGSGSPQCAARSSPSTARARPCTRARASGHELIEHDARTDAGVRGQPAGAHAGRCGPTREADSVVRDSVAESRSRPAPDPGTPRRHRVRRYPAIERCGGGGVRCMLAEIHLPSRAGRVESASALLS